MPSNNKSNHFKNKKNNKSMKEIPSSPPIPPGGRIRGGSLGDSTRGALDHRALERKRVVLRDRADSTGSTRGAFYPSADDKKLETIASPPPPIPRHIGGSRSNNKKKRTVASARPAVVDKFVRQIPLGQVVKATTAKMPTTPTTPNSQDYFSDDDDDEADDIFTAPPMPTARRANSASYRLPSPLAPIRDVSREYSPELDEILKQHQQISPNIYNASHSSAPRDSLRYSDRSLAAVPAPTVRSVGTTGSGSGQLVGTQWLAMMDSGNLSAGSGNNNKTAPPPPPPPPPQSTRLNEIQQFSNMASNYGSTSSASGTEKSKRAPPKPTGKILKSVKIDQEGFIGQIPTPSLWDRFTACLDPTSFLLADVHIDKDGVEYFVEREGHWTLRGWIRKFFWNPLYPEFTSLHQFCWAVIIGIAMGVYTAVWKTIIEFCVDFFWATVPEHLKEWGFFTELDGFFPLYHYMWICPTIFGGILSYIFASLPNQIPGQNEWITAVHSQGVQDHGTFWNLFVLSTMGMASGLSLGPELPLVLTAGMAGSYLAVLCKQSVLQARIMNLTAASAAVGGFFGFPMAGAMFVLEIPHRMGLQYFEALSPATIASIIAVLVNRMVTGNEVTGYYNYPFLKSTLPSRIFTSAVAFGLFGAGIGVAYATGVLKLKKWVHDIFHAPHDDHHHHAPAKNSAKKTEKSVDAEHTPLVGNGVPKKPDEESNGFWKMLTSCSFYIKKEPRRAAVAGCIAGFLVGVTGIFVPHVMFWGEAQLQSLIDKGRTPLPVFGQENEPTADLTAYSYCLIDPNDQEAIVEGYSLGCSALIAVSKVFVTGLSLGTGIVGGHFWGPLFTGCIASHFLTDLVNLATKYVGFGHILVDFPCVSILCTMGSTHVVTFRAHLAIMLILTLTISSFDPEGQIGGTTAGDYSAVFPLLVVSVFISLMVTRDTIFYKAQRSRGDITALPAILCQPGQEGSPMIVEYERDDSDFDGDDGYDGYQSDSEGTSEGAAAGETTVRTVDADITQDDIELQFQKHTKESNKAEPLTIGMESFSDNDVENGLSSARLDDLLSTSFQNDKSKGDNKSNKKNHRRTKSESAALGKPKHQRRASSSAVPTSKRRPSSGSSTPTRLVRVSSYGQVQDFQPSLVDQARMRASSLHRKLPSLPKSNSGHNRNKSGSSTGSSDFGGALAAALDAAAAAAGSDSDSMRITKMEIV